MKGLTDTQKRVLAAIKRFLAANRIMPSVRQLGDAVGIRHPNVVRGHLMALERKGYIERVPEAARGIILLDRNRETQNSNCAGACQ